MASKLSVDTMLSDFADEGFTPNLVAVDTFAKSLVGMNENEQRDTGMWIESADRLRNLGHGVIFLHHTKKNTEFGVQYRGSTAIMAGIDTGMTLVRDEDHCTLTVVKQKDHDEGPPMRFKRVLVETGKGKSCVLIPAPIIITDRESDESVGDVIAELLEDATYESDRARARELAKKAGLSEMAAQARISRAQRKSSEKNI